MMLRISGKFPIQVTPVTPLATTTSVENYETHFREFEDKREAVIAVSYSNYLSYPGRIFRSEI